LLVRTISFVVTDLTLHTIHQTGGFEAATCTSNFRVSKETKEHAAERLGKLNQSGGQVVIYDCTSFTHCIVQTHFQGKKREQRRKWNNEGNVHVFGGYKAALKSNSRKLLRPIFLDSNVSLEAKQHAKDILKVAVVEASGRIIFF
jgi:hypothetical protein